MRNALSRTSFSRVYETGRRVSGRLVRVVALPGEGRFGYATPSKLGCHARRNQLKRRLREAVSQLGARLDPRFDVVVVGLVAADRASFADLCGEIADLLPQAYRRWDES